MTQAVVQQSKGSASQKVSEIREVLKPEYLQKAYDDMETLQYTNENISVSNSIWNSWKERRIKQTELIAVRTYTISSVSLSFLFSLFLIINEVSNVGEIIAAIVGGIVTGFIPVEIIKSISTSRWGAKFIELRNKQKVEIRNWVQNKYQITVNDHDLNNIFTRIAGGTENTVVVTDQTTGFWYEMKADGQEWVFHKVNSQTPKNISAIESPATVNNERVDNVLQVVNSKIATLKTFNLAAEDAHSFNRAIEDTHQTVALTTQLKQLGDENYTDKSEQALKMIDADLDGIIERQKSIISDQLRIREKLILNR